MKCDIWLSNEEVKNLERGGFITLTQPDGLRITITYDRPEYEESENERYEYIGNVSKQNRKIGLSYDRRIDRGYSYGLRKRHSRS